MWEGADGHAFETMRDIFIAVLALGAVPFALFRVHIGTLVWAWLSLMVPHRLSWGFAYDLQFVQFIAIATIVAAVLRMGEFRLPEKREVVLLLIIGAFFSLTTALAFSPQASYEKLIIILKLFALFFIITVTINTKEKVHALVWVVVISILFYGVKGGVFTVLTGGNFRVYGPPGSYLGANNAIGVAVIAVLPLTGYLVLNTANRWVARAVGFAGLLSVMSVLGSFSRGALLGLIVMSLYLVFRWSRRKGAILAVVLCVGVAAAAFMPSHWYARMGTILQYEEDRSAQGRLNSWKFAYDLAVDRPLTGGGFYVFYNPDARATYAPGTRFRAAHSIVFQVLGEHGFVGLGLFLMLLYLAWSKAGRVRGQTRNIARLRWAFDLSSMLQASLVGYFAAGLFLDVAYFDLLYVILGLVVAMSAVVSRELTAASEEVPPLKTGVLVDATKSR